MMCSRFIALPFAFALLFAPVVAVQPLVRSGLRQVALAGTRASKVELARSTQEEIGRKVSLSTTNICGQKSRVPGAGIGNIKPYTTILKDGFYRVACVKDQLLEVGDKFGKNKHSYNQGSLSNVSILRYTELVAKHDQEKMSPKVCFEMCRTIPDMHFFGIAHGRDCYCAPFFEQAAGDSSKCDDVCEGDQTQMCGGKTKSSIFEMHLCGDTANNLKDAYGRAMGRKQVLSMEINRLDHIAQFAQERAEVVQSYFGSLGDPVAAEQMQHTKVLAGKIEAMTTKNRALMNQLADKATEGHGALPAAGTTTLDNAATAEKITVELNKLTEQANNAYKDLMKLQDSVSPRVFADDMESGYYPAMYFVDKKVAHVPQTCAGTMIGDPIVGKNFAECARACDLNVHECVGFSFFPSRLCFLFSSVTSVTHFSGCSNLSTSGLLNRVTCGMKFSKYNGIDITPDPSGKRSHRLKSLTKRDACPEYSDRGEEFHPDATFLSKEAFADGTYIIDRSGVFELTEDIAFEPQTPLFSGVSGADVMFPDPLSEKYTQTGGYFLGFFAAVAIEADNVVLDCKGHTIEMTEAFHKRQRFFSSIELGSKPFISGTGPPQFANSVLSPANPRVANNVVVKNCKLGLSSHHGIHGNNNDGVTLQNLQIKDFEVGGVHLNGASNVVVENTDIGPSLKRTFRADLSQAILLDHLLNTLLLTQPDLNALRLTTEITLSGQTETVDAVFNKLHDELNEFLTHSTGNLVPLFGDGTDLPDGSAVYGLVIHKTGPAVADFGSCPFLDAKADGKMISNVTLKNINIHDLEVKVFQMTRLMLDGNQVMGPAGDVFNFVRSTTQDRVYVGNPLSDAQLAAGALKRAAETLELPGFDKSVLPWCFGATHIPEAVVHWAAGTDPWEGGGSFECQGDAMSHHNKGAVGLRLSYLTQPMIENVDVNGVSNTGIVDADPSLCTASNYKGLDSRGVAIVNGEDVETGGITVAGVASSAGTTTNIDVMRTL